MTDKILKPNDMIPRGSFYTSCPDGIYMVSSGGNMLPSTPCDKDTFTRGDYSYVYERCKEGWVVSLASCRSKTKYANILESICGKPIVDVSNLFKGCVKMVKAPNIPGGVKYMNNTFEGCSALRFNIHINNGVIATNYTYKDCISLENASYIPSTVESMKGMYSGCMLCFPPEPNYEIEAFENCCFDLWDHSAFISESHELDIESYREGKTRQYLPHEAWKRFMEFKAEYECDWLPF